MANPPYPDQIVSLASASEVLGLSVGRLRQLVARGDLKATKIGNAWAVADMEVLRFKHTHRPNGRPRLPVRINVWVVIERYEPECQTVRAIFCVREPAEAFFHQLVGDGRSAYIVPWVVTDGRNG